MSEFTGPAASGSAAPSPTAPSSTAPATTAPGARQCPAVAAQAVLPLVNGPLLAGEVLASWYSAMALAVDTPAGTRVIGLLAAEASGVPHGIRLDVSAEARPFRTFTGGDPVFVGAGSIRLQGWQIRPTRIYPTAVGILQADPTCINTFRERMLGAPIGIPAAPLVRLQEALAEQDAAGLRTAVTGLVGLGAGLTPGGDDILAGLLVGLHALGRAALVQQIGVAMSGGLTERTTVFSADLLRMATAGHASTETLAVLRALDRRTANPQLLPGALDRLLAVGHTSGADLATGLLLGLTQPSAQSGRNRVHARGAGRKSA